MECIRPNGNRFLAHIPDIAYVRLTQPRHTWTCPKGSRYCARTLGSEDGHRLRPLHTSYCPRYNHFRGRTPDTIGGRWLRLLCRWPSPRDSGARAHTEGRRCAHRPRPPHTCTRPRGTRCPGGTPDTRVGHGRPLSRTR